jgi:hypothetical protein
MSLQIVFFSKCKIEFYVLVEQLLNSWWDVNIKLRTTLQLKILRLFLFKTNKKIYCQLISNLNKCLDVFLTKFLCFCQANLYFFIFEIIFHKHLLLNREMMKLMQISKDFFC